MKKVCFLILPLFVNSCSRPTSSKKEVSDSTTQKQEQVENKKEKEPELAVHSSKFRIVPVDQSSEDQSLKLFVSELRKVVKQKDLEGLIHCLDTGIVSSYGGGEYGIPIFKTRWGLNEKHQDSEIWRLLDKYISMGGAWDDSKKSRFCFPYLKSNSIYSQLKLDLDCYSMVTCTAPRVVVYQQANINSKKIGILSYEVLTATNVSGEFTKIQTVDGSISGYMLTKQLMRCYEDHPVLEKINEEWKITSFAPYD